MSDSAIPDIGLLSTPTIGGGLVFLILAHNLQQNGYKVTFYSDSLVQLNAWFPDITIKSLTKSGSIKDIAKHHDLLIAKANLAPLLADKMPFSEFAKLCVANFWGRRYFHKELLFDHAALLKEAVKNKTKLAKLLPLTKADSVIFSDISRTWPMVKTMEYFCENTLGLKSVTKNNGLIPLSGLQHRKHKRRVIIHATCSTLEKKWPLQKFIKLARRLKKRGWEPVFTMSPAERTQLKDHIEPAFSVPVFATLHKLAEFVYESGFMIGNDSGTGHLAACLNIPNLIITSVCSGKFRWRPGWGYGEIVKPMFKIKIKSNEYWKTFLPVCRVEKQFHRLREKIK